MNFSSQQIRTNPAADAAALLNRIGVGVLLALVPTLLIGARHPVFVLYPVGSIVMIIAALLDPQSRAGAQMRQGLASPNMVAFALFFLWSWVSLLWAPAQGAAALRFGQVTGALVLGLVTVAFMPERTRLANLNIAPIGLGLAVIAGLALTVFMHWRVGVAKFVDDESMLRGTLGAVVLLWPALGALGLRGRWGWAAVVAALVGALTLTSGVGLAALALVVGIVVFALGLKRPMLAANLLAGAAALLLLTAPLLPTLAGWLMPKVATFHDLYDLLATVAAWQPIFAGEGSGLLIGHGIDAAAQSAAGGLLPQVAATGILFQLWFDLGVLGALFAAILIGLGVRATARADARLAPFMVAGIASALTIAIAHFTLSQIWWVDLVGIAGVAVAHNLRGRYLEERPKLRGAPASEPGLHVSAS
ncbi:MAG: hypothetical protein KGQ37_03055 [Hyphomicrobiales bacterium]|nr:hypothetical protein [Hyphomicrobiales bacterium]